MNGNRLGVATLAVSLATLAAVALPQVRHLNHAAPAVHTVSFGVSQYPISGAAGWVDSSGRRYLVPLGTFDITTDATGAWITADDDGAECTLQVDRQVVATATATVSRPAVCEWGQR